MLGRLLAGSPSVRIRGSVAASVALLLALAGRSSAQQVQWVQSPINGHWYGAEYSPRTWTDSEALAVGIGGHLATIRSQPEQDWLQNTFGFANGTAGGLWIGFSDAASEGTWTWTSGDPSTYTDWGPSEPNGGASEDYCQVYPIGSLAPWQWNDAPDNALSPNARPVFELPSLPVRSWSWPTTYATGLHPHYGCLGDFDGDGDLDYASPDLDAGQVSVYLNDGHGNFSLSQTIVVGGHPVTLVPLDLDADQDLDLVATDLDGRLLSLTNNGSGGFSAPYQIAAVPVAHGLATGDMNNDGLVDLVVTSAGSDSRIRVFFAQVGGGFQLGQTINAIFAEDFFSTVADLNGDGYLDLAVSGSGIGILLGSASGAFTFAGQLGIGPAGRAAAADLDGDGDIDLLVPRMSGTVAEVWTNNGSGVMTNTQVVAAGTANWAEAADLDGDGDFDIVVGNRPAGTLTVLNNNGQGAFSVDATLVLPSWPCIALCGDLDGDGKADVLSGVPDASCFLVTVNQSIFDCNANGIDDLIDIQSGTAQDCDGNLRPDSCDIAFGFAADCNGNGRPDACDIAGAQSQDCNANGIPDECEIASGQSDCDTNGLLDACEIASNPSLDLDHNGVLDSCQNPGTPYCFGDGTGHACPCDPGQIGSTGHGCANSSGEGAILSATGAVSVTGDSLQLHIANMPNPSSVLFFQGTVQQGSGLGTFNGDGLLCVNGIAGSLIRLGAHGAQPGSSDFGAGIGNDPLISVRGQIPAAGGTRYYQAWYRDNTAFCAPQPYNFSNGLGITWTP